MLLLWLVDSPHAEWPGVAQLMRVCLQAVSLASGAQTFTKADGSIFQLFLSDPVTLLPDK